MAGWTRPVCEASHLDPGQVVVVSLAGLTPGLSPDPL